MADYDKDLRSIQQARQMVEAAHRAQQDWATATQEQVDRVCEAMAQAAFGASERLGRMAAEETGYGVPEHKKLKNEFGSMHVWRSIRDVRTVGVVHHDAANKVYEIAWPMGVVAALTPSTNPTSTTMNKILISVKARNGVVVAPHPTAAKCCVETARLMSEAATKAGAPEGLVQCMAEIMLPGTQELMRHKYTSVILATGGSDMVRAAHSVGKPAYGVGPGNVPAYVDRSANLERAARYIVASKAFDHSVICATEQAVIADRPIAARLLELMRAEGAHVVSDDEADLLRNTLFFENGTINPQSVGKSPQYLAAIAGFRVPDSARILVVKLQSVGRDEPLSREKLTTVLGWYEVDGWEAGCDISLSMIHFGGRGHSQIIHAEDMDVIMRFGLEKPVFRIGVNTMGTLGMIGLTTRIAPSMTLGSGGVGGSVTGDNITVRHLFNVKRMAFEVSPPPEQAMRAGAVPAGNLHGPHPAELENMVLEAVHKILGATGG